MEVVDRSAAEAADHHEAHRQASGSRYEHQELHSPQLGQGSQGLLGNQMLLFGVGGKGDRGVERQIPAQATKPQGVQPGRLEPQQKRHYPEQGITDLQGQLAQPLEPLPSSQPMRHKVGIVAAEASPWLGFFSSLNRPRR